MVNKNKMLKLTNIISGNYSINIDKKSSHYSKLKKYEDKLISFEVANQFKEDYIAQVNYEITEFTGLVIELKTINKERLSYLNNQGYRETFTLYNEGNKTYYLLYIFNKKDYNNIKLMYSNYMKLFQYVADFLGGIINNSLLLSYDGIDTKIITENKNFFGLKHLVFLEEINHNNKLKKKGYKSIIKEIDNNSIGNLKFNDLLTLINNRATYKGGYNEYILDGNILTIKNEFIQDIFYVYFDGKSLYYFGDSYINSSLHPFGKDIINILLSIFNSSVGNTLKFIAEITGRKDNQIIFYEYRTNNIIIRFTTNGVILEHEGGKRSIYKNLIRKEIEIKGVGVIEKVFGIFNEKAESNIYVLNVEGNELTIDFLASKKEFNRLYGDKMFFYGDDNDLGLFFEALNNYKGKLNIYVNNGIYSEAVILGSNIIIDNNKDNNKYLFIKNKYNIRKEGIPIDYKTYINEFIKLYPLEFSLPIILQGLVCGGMNAWSFTDISPALYITGETSTGKSTMMKMIKSALGYSKKSRIFSASAITKQFISAETSDNGVIFIDELTSKISVYTEKIIRDILNKTGGGRGNRSNNIIFNFASPFIITGERTMVDESLNNRFVLIDLVDSSRKNKVSGDLLKSLFDYNISLSLYSKYQQILSQPGLIQKTYKEYSEMLFKDFDRMGNIRASMFTFNKLFECGFNDNTLKGIMKNTLSQTGLDNYGGGGFVLGLEEKFEVLISKLLYKNKSMVKIIDKDNYMKINIMFIDENIYEINRTKIHRIINDLRNKYEGVEFNLNSQMLSIKIHLINGSKGDEAFYIYYENELEGKIARTIYNR